MKKCFVSVFINPKENKHFEVPEPVYNYILQLELAIKHPRKSKIKELYPKLKIN
jgi:hypothetical protein